MSPVLVRSCFPLEVLALLGGVRDLSRQHLDGHLAPENRVLGDVDQSGATYMEQGSRENRPHGLSAVIANADDRTRCVQGKPREKPSRGRVGQLDLVFSWVKENVMPTCSKADLSQNHMSKYENRVLGDVDQSGATYMEQGSRENRPHGLSAVIANADDRTRCVQGKPRRKTEWRGRVGQLDLVFSWVKENVMKEIYLLQSRPEPKPHVDASSLLLQYNRTA